MKYLEYTIKTPLQHVQYPDLLLKHPNATLVIYKRRQMKHLRHAFEILATYVYNHCNICNIHKKQLKHTFETNETLETCACNMSEKASRNT